jgi:peroxiredoxin (alkyl hydroperoxide reductase subunit C)
VRLGATIVAVSRDTKFVHLAWQRHEKALAEVKYLMGSDPTGRLCRAFGVLDEESGLALRGTFLIDPQGRILNSEVNFYNLGRNVDELMRRLKANIHLGRHPEHACPAQWREEGDKTLVGSAKLVGKVGEAMEAPEERPPPPKAPARDGKSAKTRS